MQQLMQAIIVTGGKQYNVSEGDTLFIEKLDVNAGDAVVFDQVLAIVDGENTKFGTPDTAEQVQRIREMYSKDRDVQLILLVRHEDGKCICRIKCPINPLPIKGEFQCVSTGEMTKLLKSMGWTYKEKVHSGMFA